MDEIVKAAMAKWPKVPHCYGWLGLDARGRWFMRDDRAQAWGAFASGASGAKGALLTHDKLIAFIGRNYACDANGCWYFQNGPQRVYVELQVTPWVWRIGPGLALVSHTGLPAQLRSCCVDASGHVYLDTDLGFGLVHTLDVHCIAQALELGLLEPQAVQTVDAAQLPARHGYVLSPQARQQMTAQK